MSKVIHKALALSLALLILLSNLSYLKANTLSLVEASASNSNEPMVKETEVQVPEAETPKTNSSKVVTPKAKSTKVAVATETKATKEAVAPKAKDAEEVVVPEVEAVKEVVAPEVETAKEVVAPEAEATKEVVAPEAEATKEVVAPEAEATKEVVVPEAEATKEVVIPEAEATKEVVAPEAEATKEVVVPEAEDIEEVVVPEVEDIEEVVAPEVEDTTEVVEPETKTLEVSESKDKTTEDSVLPENESSDTEDVGELTIPEADQPLEVVPTTEPAIELPATETTEPETTEVPEVEEPTIEVPTPETLEMVEKVVVASNKTETEETPVQEEPEVEAPVVEEPTIEVPTPKTLEMVEKVVVVEVNKNETEETVAEEPEMQEEVIVEKTAEEKTIEELAATSTDTVPRGELFDEEKAKEYVGKITTMLSQPNDSKLKLRSEGKNYVVHFAIFTCDTTMCEGFKDGVAEYYEGRRGQYEFEVEAPVAKDNYVFKCWEKVGTAPVGSAEVPCDVYRAVYELKAEEKVENAFSTLFLEEQILDVPDVVEDAQADEVAKEAENKENEIVKHDNCRPADGIWTKIEGDVEETTNRTITINYQGHYCYVSFAKFKCDTEMCVGFGGASEIIEGRRGESKLTITAPEAKDGYRFDHWEKVESEKIPDTTSSYYDVYVAVYKANAEVKAESQVSTFLLQQQVMNVAESNLATNKDHECHRAEKDPVTQEELWTKITGNYSDKTITVIYGGCYSYVSFAKFVCDLNMCEGFDGLAEKEASRRGGSEVTVTAPRAKDGYRFDHWEKSTTRYNDDESIDATMDVYRAVYVAE